MHQFEKYALKVYDVYAMMSRWQDGRRDPDIMTFDVVNSLFHTALLRIPSLNALEGNLKTPDFQMLLGYRPQEDEKVFSADTMVDVLDTLVVSDIYKTLLSVFWRAERNKAFREGGYATLRIAALDGWEPFCSYSRHCDGCLERQVAFKENGETVYRTQYYHRYVVALMLDPVMDIVLAIEPVRKRDVTLDAVNDDKERHEGEQTAALRLMDRIHRDYGTFIDAFVLDGLYANGPAFTKITELKYGAFVVLKNDKNDPLRFANEIWEHQEPCQIFDDSNTKERITFWDIDDVSALKTYDGSVRVIKAQLQRPNVEKPSTWCIALLGKAKRVSRKQTLRIIRSRWHIENTAFHQWVTRWNLNHVFRHTANAVLAVLLIWSLAFNLLQLFLYRRLRRPRRPKDPTDTIRHLIEVMLREVGTLTVPIPWINFLDTS